MPSCPALHLSSSASCLWLVQRMKPGLGYGEGRSGLPLEPAEAGVGAIRRQFPRRQFAERGEWQERPTKSAEPPCT